MSNFRIEIVTNHTLQPVVRPTQSRLVFNDYLDHLKARIGYKRAEHRVVPGLYALGNPTPESPVFVSANYTLSFDALRSALDGVDGYILVLDTKGVNVWCAAGEGTFGTDELVSRIETCQLKDIVSQRQLILPQLGAPGISAHEVRKRSGFQVKYGPVRAADLPEYLRTGEATPEMRLVRFTLADRLTVAVVDVIRAILPILATAVFMYYVAGVGAAAAVVASALSGHLLFPTLLPWLPGSDFTSKGLVLGFLVAIPFALGIFQRQHEAVWWLQAGYALCYLLVIPPSIAFLALLFSGSTTYSSRSGVRREIFAYVPRLATLFSAGLVVFIALFTFERLGKF
jgi:hypothetical protein